MSPSRADDPNGKLRKVEAGRRQKVEQLLSGSLGSLSQRPGSWFPAMHVQNNDSRAVEASAEISFVWLPRKRGRTMRHTSKIKWALILVSVGIRTGIALAVNLISEHLLFQGPQFMQQERAQRKQVMKSLLPFQLIVVFCLSWSKEGLHKCHRALLCCVLSRVSRSLVGSLFSLRMPKLKWRTT